MKPNSRKNRKLRAQYPFVDDLLRREWALEPFGEPEQNYVDDLTIQVQRVDGDLLFRRANNVGLGDDGFLAELTCRRGQLARRGEGIFVVDQEGRVRRRMLWPRNREDHPRTHGDPKHGQFAREVLCEGHRRFEKTGHMPWVTSYVEETGYLVWVTVVAWYKQTGKHKAPGDQFGKLLTRIMHITIYLMPEGGLAALVDRARMEDHLLLTGRVLTDAALDKDMAVWRLGGNIDELLCWFTELAYRRGIQEFLISHRYGTSLNCGPVRLLARKREGRNCVLLLCDHDWLHLASDAACPDRLQILDFSGTIPRLRGMVLQVVNALAHRPTLVEDLNVEF